MEIRTLESESSLIISIKGLLDTSHSKDLENFIDTKLGKGYRKFLLDCSHLESVSSGGIGFLIRLHEKMKSTPGLFCVIADINPEISKILKFFGIEKKIPGFKKVAEAKNYLSKINVPSPASISSGIKKEEPRNTAIVGRSPYKDRIRFYYKGISPAESSFKKQEPVSKLEPVSSLDPISIVDSKSVVNSQPKEDANQALPQEKNDQNQNINILNQLESRIEEIKKEVRESKEGLQEFIQTDLESKFSQWEKQIETNIQSKTKQNSIKEEIFLCESCGTRLRVRNHGKYKCPGCNSEFLYKGLDFISYLEKLA